MRHLYLLGCFFAGLLLALINKADDRARGNDPNVPKWPRYFTEYWIPLTTRAAIETAIFALLFNAEILKQGLEAIGWTNWAWATMMVTQFLPVAFLFGLSVDPIMEKIVNKLGALLPFNVPVIPPPQKVATTIPQVLEKIDAIADKEKP